MKKLTATLCLTAAVFAISISTAVAGPKHDYTPSTGAVYGFEGTGGPSFIKYKCKKLSAQLIDCKFIETSIWNNKTNNDWKKEKKKLVKEFRGLSLKTIDKEISAVCKYAENISKSINRKKKVNGKVFDDLKEIQQTSLKSVLLHSEKICNDPTEQNFIAFRKYFFSQQIKTCTIRTQSYQLNFIRQKGDKKIWVAKSAPTGPCGQVYLDRFELGLKPLQIQFGFWNYFQRTAITNPRGKTMGGLRSCSKMDERTYSYTISKRPVFRKCEFIEISLF